MRVIEQQLPDTKLGVSSLFIRNDERVLNNKLTAKNKLLTRFCNSNGWDFIDNSNIGNDCLNHGGLHFNRSGVIKLAGNFRYFINNNN